MDKLFDLASRSITGAKTFSRASLSRRTVALLSVVGLVFSSLLAVIPLSAPAANHSTQVANRSSAATSQLDFREAGSGAAGRAAGPLRAGASPSDDRFVLKIAF